MKQMNPPRFLLIGLLALLVTTMAFAEQLTSPPTKSFTYKKIGPVELEMIVHYPPSGVITGTVTDISNSSTTSIQCKLVGKTLIGTFVSNDGSGSGTFAFTLQ